jgi:hypothetical protein
MRGGDRGRGPGDVTGRVQYGPAVPAKAALAVCAHHLPVARAAFLVASLTGVTVSAEFMAGVRGKAAARLGPSPWPCARRSCPPMAAGSMTRTATTLIRPGRCSCAPTSCGSSAAPRSQLPTPNIRPRSQPATQRRPIPAIPVVRLAYCIVLGLERGHLIYAKGSEKPAHHVVRRSGIEIICHAVDLDAEPGALLAQMRALAALIVGASNYPQLGLLAVATA